MHHEVRTFLSFFWQCETSPNHVRKYSYRVMVGRRELGSFMSYVIHLRSGDSRIWEKHVSTMKYTFLSLSGSKVCWYQFRNDRDCFYSGELGSAIASQSASGHRRGSQSLFHGGKKKMRKNNLCIKKGKFCSPLYCQDKKAGACHWPPGGAWRWRSLISVFYLFRGPAAEVPSMVLF